MRLFIAIDLEAAIRNKITRFLDGVRAFAPEARWVQPESLHITLKFIGEQKPQQVDTIRHRLRMITGKPIEMQFLGTGFFPTARAPRVFWIGVHAAVELVPVAATIDSAMAELGIPREIRPFSPHLTLARRGGGSGAPAWRKGDAPNSTFAILQKRVDAMGALDFGTMTAREFFLYQSQLSPKESKYTKIERYPLATGQ